MVRRGSDLQCEPFTAKVNYHFPCEWFAGEITSAVNGSQGKSIPLQTIHRGSDIFDLKILIIA